MYFFYHPLKLLINANMMVFTPLIHILTFFNIALSISLEFIIVKIELPRIVGSNDML